MMQLGQYPAPTLVIAHFSDPHFRGDDDGMFGVIDTRANLVAALDHLERSGSAPKAIVFTGDLADLGEPGAYRRLRASVEPVANRMGTRLIWVMGNHDERAAFRRELLDESEPVETEPAPHDRVYDIDGLRIVVIDTTVPGYHHGELSDAQLDWLAGVLASPAPLGTLLAMHHPPIPTTVEVMAILELQRQDRLAAVVAGTDVRGILAGHLHYSTHGMFAGIPVSVAAASCYTIDVATPSTALSGVSGGQSFSLVSVYDDQIVHSTVPVGDFTAVTGFTDAFLENLSRMSPHDRLEAFSSKRSPYTVADIEAL
ncbi:phosphodiesterase [Marisediminicola senii]|uniref:phosphodiesterase n=1 Tax=Marisediminicola senii TaxID=2711233 RepID=UPI0013EDB233|nr:phosphodiesterase [Marisediminicola senii]